MLIESPRNDAEGHAAELRCPRCGGSDLAFAWQTFANGTRHIRVSCTPCGAYVRYAPQTPANVARADAATAETERR